jgi:hypothetical protein
MAVFTAASTSNLYGTSNDDWNLVDYNTVIGGMAFSAQNLADGYVFDTQGVVALKTSLNYGNFLQSALTKNMSKFILQERSLVEVGQHLGVSESRACQLCGQGLRRVRARLCAPSVG